MLKERVVREFNISYIKSNLLNQVTNYMDTILSKLKSRKYIHNARGGVWEIDDNITFVLVNSIYICPMLNDNVCCLHPILVDNNNGSVYISNISVSPLVYFGDIDRLKNESNLDIEIIDIDTFNHIEYFNTKKTIYF